MKRVIVVGIVLLLIPLVSANCFLYQDSEFFCKDLSLNEAKEECQDFDDCDLNTHFREKSCKTSDYCKKVLCKSTCTRELLGNCPAGEISSQEAVEWCNPGCCRFAANGINYCADERSKWLCEVGARNREATLFHYDTKLTEQQCSSACSKGAAMMQGLQMEQVSKEEGLPVLSAPKVDPAKTSTKTTKKTTQETPTESGVSLPGMVGLVWIPLILIVGFLLYHFRGKITGRIHKEVPVDLPPKKESPPSLFSPFFSSALTKLRIKKKKDSHTQKVKKHQQQEMLSQAGLTPLKVEKTHFDELHKVITSFDRKKKYAPLPEKTPLQHLETLGEKKLREEQQKKVAEQRKLDSKDALSQLRDMVKK